MAYADYYSCDICGRKTFYDADLDYGGSKIVITNPETGHPWPVRVGFMIVLCEDCALTHRVSIVEKDST